MKTFISGANIHLQHMTNNNELLLCCPTLMHSHFKLMNVRVSNCLFSYTNDEYKIKWKMTGAETFKNIDLNMILGDNSLVKLGDDFLVSVTKNNKIVIHRENGSSQELYLQPSQTEDKEVKKGDTKQLDGSLKLMPKIKFIEIQEKNIVSYHEDNTLRLNGLPVELNAGITIIQVSVGKEHSIALTEGGEVLTWGSGMKGQLGHGQLNITDHPEPIQEFSGLCVKFVEAGGWSSAVVTQSGDVYTWGWNEQGQLGLPADDLKSEENLLFTHTCKCDTEQDQDMIKEQEIVEDQGKKMVKGKEENIDSEFRKDDDNSSDDYIENYPQEVINVATTPQLLEYWKKNVVEVSCGNRHTLFLLEDYSVWACGWNGYGQLGLGHLNSVDKPVKINKLAGYSIREIQAKGWNSIFITY